MPYPSILKDLNAKAIPQVYDGNNFQPDTGKRILYGPDGVTPLSVVDSKLGVRATELETLIGEVQTKIDILEAKISSNIDGEGNSKVELYGSIVSLNENTLSTTNLDAGISETIIVQPGAGLLKTLTSFYAEMTWSGATTGAVNIFFDLGIASPPTFRMLWIEGGFANNEIQIRNSKFISGAIGAYPEHLDGEVAWSEALYKYLKRNIKYDNNRPLSVTIENGLDVALTSSVLTLNEEVIG